MQAPSAGVAVETVDGVRGMLVKMGLAHPSSRAFVAGSPPQGSSTSQESQTQLSVKMEA